jgi:hypothetical protein
MNLQISKQLKSFFFIRVLTILALCNLAGINLFAQIYGDHEFFRASLYSNSPVIAGQELILQAFGGTSWQWTGPNNFSSTDKGIIIPNTNASDAGIYNLTINDTIYDTITTYSVNVIISPAPSFITLHSKPFTTTNSDFFLDNIYSNQPQFHFIWWTSNPSVIDFATDSTIGNPIINLSDSGTYKVYLEVKDSSFNLVCTDSVAITAIRSCTSPNATILNNTTLTAFLASGQSWQSVVFVYGVFTIDQNFNMPGNVNEIAMWNNAQIVIKPGVRFKMEGVHIYACGEQMWQSINVEDDAILELSLCRIQDGINAIWVEPYKSTIDLDQCTFFDNRNGIVTWASNPKMVLKNNTFTETGNGLLPPFLNERPKAGIISLWNPLLELQYVGGPNSFEGILNGVSALNSNVSIYSNFATFKNIEGPGPDGVAISLIFSPSTPWSGTYQLLKEGNNDPFLLYDIQDCDEGIHVVKTHLVANNNIIKGVITGIKADLCSDKMITLDHNNIECTYEGIFLYQCDPAGYIDVVENSISLSPPADYPFINACIKIDETGLPVTGYENIYKNQLMVNPGGKYGIFANSNWESTIAENTVNLMDATSNLAGIKLVSCRANKIRCNSVYGDDYQIGNFVSHEPFGIQVVSTTSARYSCNLTHKTYTGIGFEDGCGGSEIRGNKMYDHTTGLYYNQYATTGDQEYKGNKWLGTATPLYPDVAARHNGPFSSSLYKVRPSCPYCLPPTTNVSGWFSNDPIPGPNFDCELMVPPCEGSGTAMSVNFDTIAGQLDYAIAFDSLQYPVYQDELDWSNDRYLYQKLSENTNLVNSDTVLAGFYQQTQDLSAGQYQDYEQEISGIFRQGQLMTAIIDSLSRMQFQLLDSLGTIKVLLANSITQQDSAMYTSIRCMLILSYEGLRPLIHAAQQALINQRTTDLSSIQSDLNQLPVTSIQEANEKVVREIISGTLNLGISNFTETQKITLFTIASQCPISGGKAVYLARSVYSSIVDTLFNDQEICLLEGIIKSSTVSSNQPSFSYFPNPAKDQLQVFWDETVEGVVTIELYDALGRQVDGIESHTTQNLSIINLRGIQNGVYFIQARYLDRIVNVGKFVVQN